jgi:hypothetical protein
MIPIPGPNPLMLTLALRFIKSSRMREAGWAQRTCMLTADSVRRRSRAVAARARGESRTAHPSLDISVDARAGLIPQLNGPIHLAFSSN